MKLSAAETERLSEKIAQKVNVLCVTFDYRKEFELWADGDLKARFRGLADAKRNATTFQKRNPSSKVKVVEIKKKVHEFHVKRRTP